MSDFSQWLLSAQGMSELPDYNKISFPENPPIPFEEILPDASEQALDLLKQFLVYPSKQRISATEVRIVGDEQFATADPVSDKCCCRFLM